MAEVGNISARATLDTASFRQGIKQMSQQMAIAREEFKQATSGLNMVDNELEISQAKFKMLTTQIVDQEKTVEQLNERYEAAKEAYGENSVKATEYRLALERARTSLTNMRTDLNNVTNRIEELSNSTEESKSKFEVFSENVEKSAEKMKPLTDAAKTAVLGLTALGVAAVTGMAVKGVMAADEMQKALNGLQTKTDSANEEMGSLKEGMLDIYNNNFGESFEDIGTAMASIKQQTNLTGKELTEITKIALLMRDTFGFEVNESLRASDMLVKTFGMSANEAYNLIAQGAQNGLDKNENLMDSINEYSIHFKQLGLSSEEMFNMFTNGAKSGVFDIDKLGDAIKEFGIRVKDGSTGTQQAFKDLGLDVDKTGQAFSKGGESANKAFKQVTTKLFEMKDPMKQNTTAVSLFGTMWEDMGSKSVKALVNTQVSISKTKDVLSDINKIKYNTFTEFVTGLGRQLDVGIAIPIGQKVLPKLNELANWAQSKMPEFQESVKTGMDIAFKAFDKLYQVSKTLISNFDLLIPAIAGVTATIVSQMILSQVVTLYTAWKAATTTMTISQWALNAALTANPIGAVVVGIGLLVAAGVALYTQWDKIKKIFLELPLPIKLLAGAFVWMNPVLKPLLLIVGAVKGIQYAMSDSLKVTDIFGSSISNSTKEAVKGYMKLSDEAEKALLKLQLNGTVVSDNISKKLVTNFTNMADQIKQAMDKKFTETLAVMQGFYDKSDVLTSSEESKSLEKLKKLHDKEKAEVDSNEKFIEMILKNASDMRRALTEDESIKITELRKNMNKLAVENLSKTEIESKTILEKMRINSSTITALQSADIIKSSIKTKEESIKNAKERYDKEIGQIIKLRDESKTITADQATKLIKEAERQKNESIKKAKEMHDGIITLAKQQSKDHINEVDWQTGQIKSKWSVFWADLKTKFNVEMPKMKASWKQFWSEVGDSVSNWGTNTKKGWVKEWNALKEMIGPAFSSMKTSFFKFWSDVANAIINWGSSVGTRWQKEWDIVSSFISSSFINAKNSFISHGKNLIDGLWEGINSKIDYVKNKIGDFVKSIPDVAKKLLDIQSPSKVMAKIGNQTVEGLIKGMEDKTSALKESASTIISDTVLQFNNLGGAVEKALINKYKNKMDIDIEPYQKQIDKLNELTKKENEKIENDDYLKSLKEKQNEFLGILDTRTEEQKLFDEIEVMKQNRERESILKSRELTIEGLNQKIEVTKNKYADLMTEENTQAYALKLFTKGHQNELITLLKTYNPQWQNAGQSFGEKLLFGINSKKESIKNTINDIMGMMNQSINAENKIINQAKKLWELGKKNNNKSVMNEAHNLAEDARIINSIIPKFSSGVNNFKGGLARINENGGEIVNLPNGTNVIPNDISNKIASAIGNVLGGQSNNVNVYITLDGKELTNTISKTQYDNQLINNRRLGIV